MAAPKIAPGETKIGWIGTGVMGQSMCGHLIDKGFSATIYSRTKEKAQGLVDKGATWVDSPKAVAEASDVIFAIVGFPSDVREVFLCPEHGALAGSKEGNILVDMTTSEPSLAKATGLGADRDMANTDVSGVAPIEIGDFEIVDMNLGEQLVAAITVPPGTTLNISLDDSMYAPVSARSQRQPVAVAG